MNEFENNNYTPDNETANSDFYSKKADDIIQDAPLHQAPPTYSTGYENNFSQDNITSPKKPKRNSNVLTIIIACALSAVIAAVFSAAITIGLSKNKQTNATNNQSNTSSNMSVQQSVPKDNVNITIDGTSASVAEAVALKCTNSVVGINTTRSISSFFGSTEQQAGGGSGVIYSADGYIITNYHVIADAVESSRSKIDVFIGDSNSTPYGASVVGYNISCDLAVLKIDASGLTPIELGNSNDLRVGQQVVTIGSPSGIEFMGSVTAGIISGLDRTVSTSPDLKLIQTDAAINPGNSGGALLDSEGKLIGINSSKIASVEYEGMGFAIPIDILKEKCDKIISQKSDPHAYLGVSISSTYTSEVLSFYGYPSGAVVSSVASGSPAYNYGIKRGDIITEFNGVEITEYTVFYDELNNCKSGDKVDITIYREGRYRTINLTLTSDTTN